MRRRRFRYDRQTAPDVFFLRFSPADFRRGLLQTLTETDALDAIADGVDIAFVENVFEAQFHRIDSETFGNHVHLRFDRPCALGHPQPSQLRPADSIRVDQRRRNANIGNSVRPDAVFHGTIARCQSLRLRAGVPEKTDIAGDQSPVFHDAGSKRYDGRRRPCGSRELFGSRHHHLDRLSAFYLKRNRDRLEPRLDLTAESTADFRADDPHLAFRDAEEAGHHAAELEDFLRAGP